VSTPASKLDDAEKRSRRLVVRILMSEMRLSMLDGLCL
jgi:hypothetical protein